jgi:hypothetical protein
MSHVVSSAPLTLQSVDNEILHVKLLATDGSVQCNIFHTPCTQVEIAGVRCTWDTADCSYDCIELACTHTFNACALMLHFLSNYMTCPLCRHGVCQKLSVNFVPLNIKRMYAQHITPPAEAQLLEFAPEVLLSDLRLHVDFTHVCSDESEVLTLTSPCIAVTDVSDETAVFRTHHSFRRHFNRIIKTGAYTCRFSLLHPLITIALYSEDVLCNALSNYQCSLPHEISIVSCRVQHDILTITAHVDLNVLYSMCIATVMQYVEDN